MTIIIFSTADEERTLWNLAGLSSSKKKKVDYLLIEREMLKGKASQPIGSQYILLETSQLTLHYV